MVVTVLLFAMLRERAGTGSVALELADGATVETAVAAVARRHGLEELLPRMSVLTALNREYVPAQVPLHDGDEIALIPPVSGGERDAAGLAAGERSDATGPAAGERSEAAGTALDRAEPAAAERPDPTGVTRPRARVTEEPLSVDRLVRAVGRPGAGAIVTFLGTTREVARLEYEAYGEMAEERMAAILDDATRRHGLEAAAAEHRVGTVPLGEPSVVVAVAASHRAEAFAGAREVIDRIKAEAPIWKKEVRIEAGTARAEWVEGTLPPGGRPDGGAAAGERPERGADEGRRAAPGGRP